jgi:hypothetical protein
MRVHLIGLMCGGIILALGCDFPTINFNPGNTGGTGAGGTNTGAAGTGTGAAGSAGSAGTTTNTNSAGSGGTAGTMTTMSTGGGGTGGTAGSSTSSTGGTGGCCDCDKDTYDAKGPVCGGEDCDDSNDLVYPGEPDYKTEPASADLGFDWDCDGSIMQDPTLQGINCLLLGKQACEAVRQGYLDNKVPACGIAGKFGTCSWNGLTCENMVLDPNRKMACK